MEKMIEKAKEELEILETQYPHRFDYLKIELKSFISLHKSQVHVDPLPSTSSATTQASTSLKRKRVYLKRMKEESSNVECSKKPRRRRDRVDVVLEKAQACLRKIHQFKSSFDC